MVTDEVKNMSKAYNFEISKYKEYAQKRRDLRVYRQDQTKYVWDRMQEYIEEKRSKGKPLTTAGLLLSIGFDKMMWKKARHGEYDYLLEEFIINNEITAEDEYLTEDNLPCVSVNGVEVLLVPYSQLVEYADLVIQEQREEACSSLKGNPAGNIFLMKAQNGVREDESPSTVNNTLVVANSDRAEEIMKMLK